jgi:hypothetical protein
MALDRGTIDEQLKALGESAQWWEEREFRDLPAVLGEDEQILAIARGKLGRARWAGRSWLIVVTQHRMLCMRSGRGGSWRQMEVATARITRVALRVGPLNGRLLVATSGPKYRLLLPRSGAYKLEAVLVRLVRPVADSVGFAPARMMHRVVDHVLALPAVALAPLPARTVLPPDSGAAELKERVEMLEETVQELQQQIDFLEQLLRQRQMAAAADALSSD